MKAPTWFGIGITLCITLYPLCSHAQSVSPYYRQIFPKRVADETSQTITSFVCHGDGVRLFSRDKHHQYGVKINAVDGHGSLDYSETIHIGKRLCQHRKLGFFSGIQPTHVRRVYLQFSDGHRRELQLYEGRYFVSVLDLGKNHLVEAQATDADGHILRRWNEHSGYPAGERGCPFSSRPIRMSFHNAFVMVKGSRSQRREAFI